MGEGDGHRHQLGRLVAGVAEHHALVAGALLGGGLADGLAGVHALRDVGALALEGDDDVHAVGVVADVVVVVADGADGLAGDVGVVELGLGGDFAGDDQQAGLGEGFARHAALRVLGEARVEDGVRDGVADFVGVAFRDRFRREDAVLQVHEIRSFSGLRFHVVFPSYSPPPPPASPQCAHGPARGVGWNGDRQAKKGDELRFVRSVGAV